MRRLTFFVLFLAALYSGYWFVGARAVAHGAQVAIAQARAEGWDLTYSDMNTLGFPSRFDTTLSDISIAPRGADWQWAAPFLQVFALSYQPNRVIAAFADDQTLRIGGQTLQITAEGLRASAGVAANTALSFDDAAVAVGGVAVASDFGWQLGLDRALVALRAAPAAENRYDAYFDADRITLPMPVAQQIDPTGVLGAVLTRAVFDSALTFDRPLDRHAVDGRGPAPKATRFTLRNLTLIWGPVEIRAQGAFDIDPLGNPDGRITFRSDQWREIIDLMVAAGAIDAGLAPTYVTFANALAVDGGAPEFPLQFRDGRMSLGPLPIGPAPRFW
ncbi:hypothetical protein SAMN04488005_2915 [Yoonia tamlensis]|uniref:DUF2125 domain-containing protein n=1 Tax=Yoonia tamlensis TaxID=390270 RepID=A0A1I6HPD7_9RHOB|nr:DUF2125 domain-containing protein [Yoonia tamlensis]SFR56315.1 hypothetical protein SAMN04488005_2915 [Yoonia tamlensis]